MKNIFLPLFVFSYNIAHSQTDSVKAVQEIISFQKELDAEYKSRDKSPLEPKDKKKFKGHPYYAVDLKYRVVAKLKLVSDSPFTPMRTTTSRLPNYRIFAIAEFTVDGKNFSAPIYQSQDLLTKPEYIDYLFFPFTDLTNGTDTYAGGRYIGLRIPKGEELVIDFNQAYHPFCAYNHKYSCPIVPSENHLNIEIKAGVKLKKNKN